MMLFVPTSSYSQLEEYNFETATQGNKIFIFIQIQIRDPGGSLVGYVETDHIIITDIDTFTKSLDKTSDDTAKKKKLFIDGKEHEVITLTGGTRYQSDTVASQSVLSNNGSMVAYANHDGFPVKAGDESLFTWTIIRLAA